MASAPRAVGVLCAAASAALLAAGAAELVGRGRGESHPRPHVPDPVRTEGRQPRAAPEPPPAEPPPPLAPAPPPAQGLPPCAPAPAAQQCALGSGGLCRAPPEACRAAPESARPARGNRAIAIKGMWDALYELRRFAARNHTPPGGEVDVVFVGDSIVETLNGSIGGGPKCVPCRNIFYRAVGKYGSKAMAFGMAGDETQHLLWRVAMGELRPLRPKVVFLMVGTNNIGLGGHPAEQVSDGVAAAAALLCATMPLAAVVVVGLLPRGDCLTKSVQYRSHGRLRQATWTEPNCTIPTNRRNFAVRRANELLAAAVPPLCAPRSRFVDCSALFLTSNSTGEPAPLREPYYQDTRKWKLWIGLGGRRQPRTRDVDFLHLSPLGYFELLRSCLLPQARAAVPGLALPELPPALPAAWYWDPPVELFLPNEGRAQREQRRPLVV